MFRQFKILFISILSSFLFSTNGFAQVQSGTLAIMQGATSDEATQFTVLVPKKSVYTYHVELRGKGIETFKEVSEKIQRDDSDWAIEKIFVSGLNKLETYDLVVRNEDAENIDRRQFRLVDLYKKSFNIGFGSCMKEGYEKVQKQIWQRVYDNNLDFMFFLGDNVYMDLIQDSPDPREMWNRHVSARQKYDVYRWSRLTPIMASWDDHDFGHNNARENFPYKEDSKKIFEAFFGARKIPGIYLRGPGVSSLFVTGNQIYFLMDDRSFRNAKGVGGVYSYWGKEQKQWLFNLMGEFHRPTWIFNGNQFFGGYHMKESFEGDSPESFKHLIKGLKDLQVPVILGSGDVHYTEVQKLEASLLGYNTFEITAGPLYSRRRFENYLFFRNKKRRLMGAVDFNMALAKTTVSEEKWKVYLKSQGVKAAPFFEVQLEITQASSD